MKRRAMGPLALRIGVFLFFRIAIDGPEDSKYNEAD